MIISRFQSDGQVLKVFTQTVIARVSKSVLGGEISLNGESIPITESSCAQVKLVFSEKQGAQSPASIKLKIESQRLRHAWFGVVKYVIHDDKSAVSKDANALDQVAKDNCRIVATVYANETESWYIQRDKDVFGKKKRTVIPD